MSSYIAVELRRLVETRADNLCEYCLIHVEDTYLGCQVDHVIAEKHGGATTAENLSYACAFCNRSKGADIGSISLLSGEFTRFFNPRTDHWGDHFAIHGAVIQPRTEIGEATARILGFNQPERLLERELIQAIGGYPPSAAKEQLLQNPE